MSLDTTQQIYGLIKKSHNILIAFRGHGSGDALGSALALALLLRQLEKRVELAAENFSWPKNFSFLPSLEILPVLSTLKKLVINLNLKDKQLDNLSQEVKNNQLLEISLTAKNGTFETSDLSFEQSGFKYDLIITLDTPDLELLGQVYHNNTDFFYQTPVINIDHSPANEHYGQINLVELTATSSAEIVFNLLESLDPNLLDDKIATCLLTGIITKTKSFKTHNVTPRTLTIASQLIAAGADREAIVTNLFRTRSLATLRLWGRVLARIENDPSLNLAWSIVGQPDFINAGAGEENLFDVVDELIINSPEAEIIALIYEQKNNDICCLISSKKESDINMLAKFFGPKIANDLIKFHLKDKSLLQAKEHIISELRKVLHSRNQGRIMNI
ncbi:MAG: DHH family phosphoesterase [bacterium]